MSALPAPASPRPSLPAVIAGVFVLAALAGLAAIILTVVDSAATNLPDPMVSGVAMLAVGGTIIGSVLWAVHTILDAGHTNTVAVAARIAADHRDLKTDTGEIHGLAEAMRNPHYIVVRDPGPFDKRDGDQTMRVTADAELRTAPVTGHRPPDEMSAEEWRIYLSGYNDRRARGDGPDPVA